MKRLWVLCLIFVLGLTVILTATSASSTSTASGDRVKSSKKPFATVKMTGVPSAAQINRDYDFGKIPLYFIPNKGQVNKKAVFYAKTSRYTLWMTTEALVFDRIGRSKAEGATIERDVSRLVFLKANKNPGIVPLELTRHKVNYYLGSDPGQWKKGISTSRAVLYKNIYNNIDLNVYGNERQIEYDWIVKPGANPEPIRFEYKNVKGSRIDPRGNLTVESKFGELLHHKPVCYQVIKGERVKVEADFRRIATNIYGFKTGAFDREHELIIDPVISLDYSTYLGGGNNELYARMAVDDSGQVYMTGYTYSSDYPTQNAFQDSQASSLLDAVLTKFDATGTGLIFSTYFGGSSSEFFFGIAIAPGGGVYIAGDTFSSNLPAINSRIGGKDVFIARFGASGNYLGGRYLGGTGEDRNLDLALDSSNRLLVTGFTSSSNFPTLNPYQSWNSGSYTVYVTILNSDLTTLEYSTYLGGSGQDIGNCIGIDDSGCFYVAGRTGSNNFPLKNAWQTSYGGGSSDLFLTKFKADGSDLLFSTYLGGSGDEYCQGLSVDGSGTALIGGSTASNDFPTANPYQAAIGGGQDVVIGKFDTLAGELDYSTYLGGSQDDVYGDCVLDGMGNIYVSGTTYSTNFPTKSPYQSTNHGSGDAFFTILSPGSGLLYSTFLGGSAWEQCLNVARDGRGNNYIAGNTSSLDFPVLDAYQYSSGGSEDAFITRFSTAWTLDVHSSPDEGAYVKVESDQGIISGNTHFTHLFPQGTVVTVTAPVSFNGKGFYRWSLDGADYSDRSLQVTMDTDHRVTALYESSPGISLSRTQLNFGINRGNGTTSPQRFFIRNTGVLPLPWAVTTNAAWLVCSPSSGTNSGEITVSVNGSGLTPGTYNGLISVSATGASNSPQLIQVTLTVYQTNTTAKPFGYFETPVNGATVMSSIPVTGWALDDIEVVGVKIYRREGKGLAFIGDAVFVEGARPDVELAYSNFPKNYRAGWGYMMLTNFLPGGGNGTFTFEAIATDKEGHQVTLGSKTIICDNAHAVKPFGAIDTPAQGGTASANPYRNQGWVLTPLPAKIPEDGHTITVWIDGLDVGKCHYNIYRPDVAALFPGYANSHGALAYFDFDTAAYENRVHTIQWTAIDNAGHVDGIGSRYFTAQNTNNSQQAGSSSSRQQIVNSRGGGPIPPGFSKIPLDYTGPVGMIKGFQPGVESQKIYPGENGIIHIDIEEVERLVLNLHDNNGGTAPGEIDQMNPLQQENHLIVNTPNTRCPTLKNTPANHYEGCLVYGNQLKPLPIGSTLNPGRGVFYWQPGPGFVGTYRLVFIKTGSKGKRTKKEVWVTINPKSSLLRTAGGSSRAAKGGTDHD
jgi:hypothetical protein